MPSFTLRDFRPYGIHLHFKSRYVMQRALLRLEAMDSFKTQLKLNLGMSRQELTKKLGELPIPYDNSISLGYNINPRVIQEFMAQPPTDKFEKFLYKALLPYCPFEFTLICTANSSLAKTVFKHELAHAFFAIDPQLRNELYTICRRFDISRLRKGLISIGYPNRSVVNEIYAYISSEPRGVAGLVRVWEPDTRKCNQLASSYNKLYRALSTLNLRYLKRAKQVCPSL